LSFTSDGDDVDKFKITGFHGLDPLGYLSGGTSFTGANTELTSELLAAAVRLTHPDCHPPERKELAHRVTQELLDLKPFVFPAPKPKPVIQPTADDQRNGSSKSHPGSIKEPLRQSYPCAECRSTVPYFYCATCKAEWDRRRRVEHDRETAKQRAGYVARAARKARLRPATFCTCGAELPKSMRKDARFCSNACRQRAHRAAVADVAGMRGNGEAQIGAKRREASP
jgi:hypothetical protein